MTAANKRVLITGASGLIGGLVLRDLAEKYEFTALNRRPVADIPCLQASIDDRDAIAPAFEGIDTVLHLAADIRNGSSWEVMLETNIKGTYKVFEASRTNGVKRIVFASSGAATVGPQFHVSPIKEIAAGDYDSVPLVWDKLDHSSPFWPVDFYGLSKAFGEVLGRMYASEHRMSVICLRIGAVLESDRPEIARHVAGYLSHRDCVQMIDRSLGALASIRYDVFDVVSDNRWAVRDVAHARQVLGYEPQDSSDGFTF